jgi:hypothetical protein
VVEKNPALLLYTHRRQPSIGPGRVYMTARQRFERLPNLLTFVRFPPMHAPLVLARAHGKRKEKP